MNAPISKPATAEKLLGLLIITGFMLLITAIPLGIVLSLQARYKFHSDWNWAITQGTVMTIATAIVGVLLLGIGEFIVHRHRKAQERTIHNDA